MGSSSSIMWYVLVNCQSNQILEVHMGRSIKFTGPCITNYVHFEEVLVNRDTWDSENDLQSCLTSECLISICQWHSIFTSRPIAKGPKMIGKNRWILEVWIGVKIKLKYKTLILIQIAPLDVLYIFQGSLIPLCDLQFKDTDAISKITIDEIHSICKF